ncbi:hypothetical protein XENTR_v10010229 [Xenopus tropicalis]|nr:hypothetical protein XENTR_v10010229 [Xenopus tropicalis]
MPISLKRMKNSSLKILLTVGSIVPSSPPKDLLHLIIHKKYLMTVKITKKVSLSKGCFPLTSPYALSPYVCRQNLPIFKTDRTSLYRARDTEHSNKK